MENTLWKLKMALRFHMTEAVDRSYPEPDNDGKSDRRFLRMWLSLTFEDALTI